MAIDLTTIRYFTGSEPYHYTIDNRPLSDLEANDIILKEAIEDIQTNFFQVIAQGSWPSLQGVIPVNAERGKAFAYRLKIWAIQNKDNIDPQDSCLIEANILASSSIAGLVTIHAFQAISNLQTGVVDLTVDITGSTDQIVITFNGYTGVNGFVQIKAERMGT